MPAFLLILAGALLVTAAIAVAFWGKILKWSTEHLIPWLATHIPPLEPIAAQALTNVDKVAAPLLHEVKKAWNELRRVLVRQVIEFEWLGGDQWLMRITSWIAEKIPEAQVEPELIEHETKYSVPLEQLPQKAREAWLRRNETYHRIEFTELRDNELDMDE